MNFATPKPARAAQDRSIVPMINVVFLLLIFFLMTASLVHPPPEAITTPTAETQPVDPQPTALFITADGTLIFGDAQGDAALVGLSNAELSPLPIVADAAYPAADMARLLQRLTDLGVTDIALQTRLP